MATLQELSTIQDQAGYNLLTAKIRIAAIIKAASVVDDINSSTERNQWAERLLKEPSQANSLVPYIIGKNNTATINQILNADDTTIKNQVSAAVDFIYP